MYPMSIIDNIVLQNEGRPAEAVPRRKWVTVMESLDPGDHIISGRDVGQTFIQGRILLTFTT